MSKRFMSNVVSGTALYALIFGVTYGLQFLPWRANVGIWLAGVVFTLYLLRKDRGGNRLMIFGVALTWFLWAFATISSECDYYIDRLFGIPKPE